VLTAFAVSDDEPKPLHVQLVARKVDSLNDGDPIFYRGMQVGAVATPHLGPDGTHVVLGAIIEPQYTWLIRSNTEFWNASGVDFDLGFGGVKLETGPLETFIQGGVQIATPEPPAGPAGEGDTFILQEKPHDDWQEWSPVLR
jgi:paraquat-inducible protein B